MTALPGGMVAMLELLLVAALCISTNQLSPNIVTEEVKTRVVKTKYGKVQGFVSKVSWNVKMLTNQYFSDPVSEI